jgi:hypothetical protein
MFIRIRLHWQKSVHMNIPSPTGPHALIAPLKVIFIYIYIKYVTFLFFTSYYIIITYRGAMSACAVSQDSMSNAGCPSLHAWSNIYYIYSVWHYSSHEYAWYDNLHKNKSSNFDWILANKRRFPWKSLWEDTTALHRRQGLIQLYKVGGSNPAEPELLLGQSLLPVQRCGVPHKYFLNFWLDHTTIGANISLHCWYIYGVRTDVIYQAKRLVFLKKKLLLIL